MFKKNKKYVFLAFGIAFALANVKNINAQTVQKGTWELENGMWKYYTGTHTMHKGWLEEKNQWYYLDKENGNMLTGWQVIDGSRYYFDTKAEGTEGNMHGGWLKNAAGNWYFLNNDKDSKKYGIIRVGWQWIDGHCYYFETAGNDIGRMYANGLTPDGFKVNSDGQWVDTEGKVQYVAGKGFSTKKNTADKKLASTKKPSSGGSGGGGHYGRGNSNNEGNQDKTKKPETDNKGNKPQTGILADGTWFGTGSDDMYAYVRGTEVVKVVVENGKVKSAENVKYRNDQRYERGFLILQKLLGLEDVDGLNKVSQNIHTYDAIAGATRTAEGQLSAAKNALERAKKFKNDGKAQNIEYIEFSKRPDSLVENTKLDLSKVELIVKEKGKEEKKVRFEDFSQYGIVTEPANGSELPTDGKSLIVHFKNDDNLIDIFSEVQAKRKFVKRYPTRIEVKYVDKSAENIELKNDEFRYKLESKKGVESMTLYDGEKELVKGEYHAETAEWGFDLKNVEVGAGYTSWGFETYKVKVNTDWDNSEVKSFELDHNLVDKDYKVGENFNLDKLIISYITANGSHKKFNNWREAENKGFTSSVVNGYKFEEKDVGKKTVTISKQMGSETLTKTFEINVVDTASKIPAKVEVYSGDDKILTLDIDEKELKSKNGRLIKPNQEVDKKYQSNVLKFTAKVYNAQGEILNADVVPKTRTFSISIPTGNGDENTTIMMSFKFVEKKSDDNGSAPQPPKKDEPKPEEPKTKTVEEEEQVVEVENGETTDFEYKAKVRVTFDEKTKKIIKVEDNGTNPEGSSIPGFNKQNKQAWKRITNDFWSKFVGKGESNIDGIDTVTGATRSTDAIKKAVKRALSK